jgi:hypothetical protein
VDLDQSDDIDEMEKLMRQKMNLAQKQLYQHMDRSGAGDVAGAPGQFQDPHDQPQKREKAADDNVRGL